MSGRVTSLARGASLAIALVVLAGCAETGAWGITVISDGNHRLEGRHPGAAVVVGGSLTVTEGARIGDSVWILGGSLRVAGDIGGDLSVLGGEVDLEPGSTVDGDLHLSAGSLSGLEDAEIGGDVTDQLGLDVPLTPGWQQQQTRAVQLGVAVGQITVVALLAGLIGFVAPGPLRRVEAAVATQPHVALALGLLGGLVALPLIVFMAFTIILIPVAMAALVLLGLALVYGWAAAGSAILRRVSQRRLPQAATAGAGAGLLMVVLALAAFVPLLGAVAMFVVTGLGFGAVLLTRLGLRAA
jgi:hypothetical protein